MNKNYKVSLILAAAGSGSRAKLDKNKVLYDVGDKTVLETTLSAFYKSGLIDEYVVTASEKDFDFIRALLPSEVLVVKGGNTRTKSVKNALDNISGDIVLIHDGARPYVRARIIKDCIDSALEFGSGITAIPSKDTILSGDNGVIKDYLGKGGLYLVQTPQAFNTKQIKKAYDLIGDKVFNDDGEIYKEFIGDTRIVLGDSKNVKLTYPEDFESIK